MPGRRAVAYVGIVAVVVMAGLPLPALAADSDGDGMPNRYERRFGFDPKVKDGKGDRDRDGLSNVTEFRKKTNPRKRDTDKDGLTDGREVKRTRTNPLKRDTDADRFTDGNEVRRKTNPRHRFDPCPFTGLRAKTRAGRSAVAVAVDNASSSRPQAGLETADVVIEHPVEGGLTRFLPIYGCKKATNVGPVRSARFDVTRMVKPFTKSLALSGATAVIQAHLDDKGIVSLTELTAPDAFTRSAADPAPDNLFFDASGVAASAIAGRPFRFGGLQAGTDVHQAILNFGSTSNVQWLVSDKGWLRFEDAVPSLGASGQHLNATNVLIQVVNVMHSKRFFDTARNPSPDFKFREGGEAFLLRNGRAIPGTWKLVRGKPKFELAPSVPFKLAFGRTWIEIVPSQAGDVRGSVTFME